MIISYLIRKEFIQIRRNAFLPRMIVMFPILMMCVIPWVTNLEVKNISILVVDKDHSALSQRLVHKIEASRYFIFKGMPATYTDAMKEVERSRADVVAVIPQHYGRDMAEGRLPEVFIAANSVNGTKGGMGSSYLASIIADHAAASSIETRCTTSPAGIRTVRTPSPYSNATFSILNLYNIHQDYKVFMIPALMAILIVLMCGFMPALNIVGEKETGTIEQINVTPVSKGAFILAKLIPYWIIGMMVMTVCFLLSWLIYGIVPAGSILTIYFLAMLLAFTFSGMGLLISNYSDAMQQAMFVMWFVMVCMILLSGLFTPVQSMPHWAQILTIVNPMKYFIDAMRTVFVRGGTLLSVLPQVGALVAFTVIMNIWAVISYRKNR
jgi:ABC-2 type transport system permease protein